MLSLRVTMPGAEPYVFEADKDEIKIGRSSRADLVLSDRFLSRLHTRLFFEAGKWWVEDLQSSNGTFLNKARIESPTTVKPGDEVQLSGCVLEVEPHKKDESVADSTSLEATLFRSASDILESDRVDPSESSPEAIREHAARLRILNEVHEALSRTISPSELLELILDRAFDHVGCEEGAVFLRQEDGSYERAASRATPTGAADHLYSETLLREVGDKGLAALVLDAGTDVRFRDAESIMGSGVRSLVAAPLIDPEGSLGLIVLSSTLAKREFTEDDMALLTSLASVAALRIRNVALGLEAAERQRLQEELDLARRIQIALLPASLPRVEGYSLYGRNLPSRGVSGDFYEIVEREKDCFLLVADVSGKGIAASLLTASFEALAAGPIEEGQCPKEVTAGVSKRLFERTPAAKYATAFLATLEAESGRVCYTNAGHNPALHVRVSGGTDALGPTGAPVGLIQGSAYEEGEVVLEPGDLLFVYTDGITEAEDLEGEEFGIERLIEFCKEHLGEEAEVFTRGLEATLNGFTQDQPAMDDRTVVFIHRLPPDPVAATSRRYGVGPAVKSP